MTRSGIGIVCGLWVALVGAGAGHAGEKAPPPDLTGKWMLVPERTDVTDLALNALLSPPARPEHDEGWTGGGGGFPGGGGGFPGGGRPPRREGRAGGQEGMERIRAAVEGAVVAPRLLTISSASVEGVQQLTLDSPSASTRILSTNGKKEKDHKIERKARWSDGKLVVETKAGLVQVWETFSLTPASGESQAPELAVAVRARRSDLEGELTLARVYRVTTAAPATTPPLPVAE